MRTFFIYASYWKVTFQDIFSEEELRRAMHLRVSQLQTMKGLNDGNGNFTLALTPPEMQLSPINGRAKLSTVKGRLILAGEKLYEVSQRLEDMMVAMMTSSLEILQWSDLVSLVKSKSANSTFDATSHTLVTVTRNHVHLSIFSYAN